MGPEGTPKGPHRRQLPERFQGHFWALWGPKGPISQGTFLGPLGSQGLQGALGPPRPLWLTWGPDNAPRAPRGAKMLSKGPKCSQNPFKAPFHPVSFVGPMWALCGPYYVVIPKWDAARFDVLPSLCWQPSMTVAGSDDIRYCCGRMLRSEV